MSKFIAEKSFWDLFPEAQIGIIVLKGIDNSDRSYEGTDIKEQLAKANQEAKKYLTDEQLSLCPVVSVWRDAFMKFKKKKENRSSIEALLKRVQKDKEVGPINPLVDLYNASSLLYALPCGGENLDSFKGDLRLTVTEGGDDFFALGDAANDPTLPGELCYKDDIGAVCRCWNWRDGQRTMLTEDTRNAFLIFECVDPSRHDALCQAMDFLGSNAVKYLGGLITSQKIVTKDDPEVGL